MSSVGDLNFNVDTYPFHTVKRCENMLTEAKYVDGSLRFYPPMYIQRYEAVSSVLSQLPWYDDIKKVIDFGCADLGYFLHLKYIPTIKEILEVDINEEILVRFASKAAPLTADYLFSKHKTPLTVYLLAGSIADYDDQLEGTDVVIAIEVIEHLHDEVLERVPHNIFHEIKPRIAIFTTPNADFNVLFTNLDRFRHPDHKFEWTRMEFIRWAQDIVTKYTDYTVKLYGIGVGPEDTEHLGCCSQMAVFERKPECDEEFDAIRLKRGINNYKLVREYVYPHYVDKRSNKLKIFHEVEYRLKFTFRTSTFFNSDEELFEIPLTDIYPYVSEWCDSEDALKETLLEQGFYVLEKDEMQYLSYGGYLSDSSDLEEENESMEFSEPENMDGGHEKWRAEDWKSENWEVEDSDNECWKWNYERDKCIRKPEERKNLSEVSSEEGFHEDIENGGMDSSSHEGTGDESMKDLSDSQNLSFNYSDVNMAVDQEPGIYSRSMSWSAIPQKKDIKSKNGKTLGRFLSLPVKSSAECVINLVRSMRKCHSVDSFF